MRRLKSLNRPIGYMTAMITATLVWLPISCIGQNLEAFHNYIKLRKDRAANLSRPDGLLSIIAIQRLQPGDYTVGTGDQSQIKLTTGPEMLGHLHVSGSDVVLFAQGKEFDRGLPLPGVEGRDLHLSNAVGWVEVEGLKFATLNDPGRMTAVVVKNAKAGAVLHFPGLRWYEPSSQWRIAARWVPYVSKKTLAVGLSKGQVIREPAAGYAEFTVNGHLHRLDATIDDGHLFFVVGDLTNRTTTYQGGRFLETAVASKGMGRQGTIELDFNQLTNPYCAYASFENCPRPTLANTMNFAIEAGEKRFGQ